MAVEIKELIIQGKIKGSSTATDQDIIKIIDAKLLGHSRGASLDESKKRSIIDECVLEVLNQIEAKFRF
jgi:hypothetical protein|tara:strand:- start:8326 stop:8532 length:207 start_codon:yes stop_codon:yes gene_type:complete